MIDRNSNAAPNGAAFFVRKSAGRLVISGETRLDFLQRQTSNDLRKLDAQPFVLTVLTSPVARILDLLAVFDAGDRLVVFTQPERKTATMQFLSSRVFFNDRVRIVDESADLVQIRMLGEAAPEMIQQIAKGVETDVYRYSFLAEQVIVIPGMLFDQVHAMLTDLGAQEVGEVEYDAMRVTSGVPAYPGELSEQYTPLEVGLRDLVAVNKGCYTGQEVLARQINYQKVSKRLFGIKLDGSVISGCQVYRDGKPGGVVTSVAESSSLGWIALAVLRSADFEPGQPVDVGGTTGVVVEIPF